MPTHHKRLGVHWGETGFSFVEVDHDAATISAFVPFTSLQTADEGGKASFDDPSFLDAIQKAVTNKGFSVLETYFSLPSKDVLIRWFVIPWMKTSEIQDVVAFEAKKYTPFPIDEMTYTYYPTTLVKGDARQIGILFVAIRKDVFQRYLNVLSQSGLNVVYSEPGATSLIRSLIFKKQIEPAQVTAILLASKDSGSLIITSKGHVKFIRDFKVQILSGLGAAPHSKDTDEVSRMKLFNEVRMSFEFFSRQHENEDVNKVIILSSGLNQSFWSGLSEDLGMRVDIVDPFHQLGLNNVTDMGEVAAFGVALAGSVPSVVDFNLSEGSSRQVSLKKDEVQERNRQLILHIAVGVICALLMFLVSWGGGELVTKVRNQYQEIAERSSASPDLTQEEAQRKTVEEQDKLAALKKLPLNSRMEPLVARFASLVPKGIWIENVQVEFEDKTPAVEGSAEPSDTPDGLPMSAYASVKTTVKMTFSGSAFSRDINETYVLVNVFVDTLHADSMMSSFFKNIKLSGVVAKDFMTTKKKVVAFSIVCEGK